MKQKIWDYLIAEGLTPEGAAGLMGNLQAESGLIPNRVEILCLRRYEEIGKVYTDETYTAYVDGGTISKEEFLRPMGKQYGYGLAQWTSPGRKEGLYNHCKSNGVSIGDLNAQLYYLIAELMMTYPSVWRTLNTTHDIREASNAVLMKFEMPADQGASVQQTRYNYSKAIYDEMSAVPTAVTADAIIGIMRSWLGYSEANGKYREIVDIYNAYGATHGYPRGYRVPYGVAWCDVTVSAAFIKAGAVDLIGGVECGVEEHVKIFQRNGIWQEDGTVTPEPGWIIVYDWDDNTQPNNGYADHIGIVESVNGSTITAIEGNCDDSVKRRSIQVGWGYIRGYAIPKYATASKPAKADKSITTAADAMDVAVRAEIKAGFAWTYTNRRKMEETFDEACETGNRKVNCARGVNWLLVEAGVFDSYPGRFYGKKNGTIAYQSRTVKKRILDKMDEIKVGNKTVSKCLKDGTIKPGDVVTYVGINHTNAYIGENRWFDTGHAYCAGTGEGAKFTKFVGEGKYSGYTVGCILREKAAETGAIYRVQVGAYRNHDNAVRQMETVRNLTGYGCFIEESGGYYKVICGSFEVRANADARAAELEDKGINAFVVEVT